MGLLEPASDPSVAPRRHYMDRLFRVNDQWIHAELKKAKNARDAYHQISDYRHLYERCRSDEAGYELDPKPIRSKAYYGGMSDRDILAFCQDVPDIKESWVILFDIDKSNRSFLPDLKERWPNVKQMEILEDGTHQEL